MLEPYVGFKVAIRRIWWRISSVKYVLKMKMKWALKLLQDINMMKNEEMKCKFKMSHLEEILCLSLAIHMVIMDMWRCAEEEALPWWIMGEQSTWWSWLCEDAPKKKLSHGGLWGSNLQDFVKQAIKKGVTSCCGQDHHHQSQVECTRLRFALDRVSFSPVSWCSWRPVYSLVVVLSRGLSSE